MFYVLAPFRLIYKIYFGIIFFATLLVLFPLFWIFTRKKSLTPVAVFLKRWVWLTLLQILLLLWIQKKGRKKFPDGPYILCANHSSYYDIFVSYRIAPGYLIFMGKAELAKWPLLNVFFKNGNMSISVNRKNPLGASKAFQHALEAIDRKESIVVFPEGTIADNAPVLNRFKPGAFKMAIAKQIPIVPVTYLDNWALMSEPEKLFGPCRPGISRAIIHEPIETKGMSENDLLTLQNKVFEVIENDLKKYVYPKLKKHGEK